MQKPFFYIALLLIFLPLSLESYELNQSSASKGYITKFKRYSRKTVWIGSAERYGAPTVNLIVDFINECHFRMRFSYFMGIASKSVLFGFYRRKGNHWILRDQVGNVMVMHLRGGV